VNETTQLNISTRRSKSDGDFDAPILSIGRTNAIFVMASVTLIVLIPAVAGGLWIRNISSLALLVFHGFLVVALVELPSCFVRNSQRNRTSLFVLIMPLLFQVSLLTPLLLSSLWVGLGLSDFYLWLWPMWTGSLLAVILFYALNRPKGLVAKHREKRDARAVKKSISQVSFSTINLLVIGVIVFYANFWGLVATVSSPPPVSILHGRDVVTRHAPLSQVDYFENDYGALGIIAGTYRETRYFMLGVDGTLDPVTTSVDGIYTFNQDRTLEIVQGETLMFAGTFTVTRTASLDDVSHAAQLDQQVLEDVLEAVIGHLEFDLYRIDVRTEEGFWGDIHPVLFMFRTNDERTIIYNVTFGDIAVVEQLQ